MSMELIFTCDACSFTLSSWDDGNPYYLDSNAKKHYAYHPHHDKLEKCIGNDSPYICLSCGEQFMVDSRSPVDHCPKCSAVDIVSTFELDGKNCPVCKRGHLTSAMGGIS